MAPSSSAASVNSFKSLLIYPFQQSRPHAEFSGKKSVTCGKKTPPKMLKTENFFLKKVSVVVCPLLLWQECPVLWAPAKASDQKRFGGDFSRLFIDYASKQKGCLCAQGVVDARCLSWFVLLPSSDEVFWIRSPLRLVICVRLC